MDKALNPDLIFCLSHCDPVCCTATEMGWLYGIRSDGIKQRCYTCKVEFVDINYKQPHPDKHRDVVLSLQPKYATVLDIMDSSQIDSAVLTAGFFHGHGIEPIVIPKIDCIQDVPTEYILGYSVPTPYGGTDLPVRAFSCRGVHILGGSPKRQATYYRLFLECGCTVTSIDGNSISKAASRGTVWRDRDQFEWHTLYRDGRANKKHYHEILCESLENVWGFWQETFADPYRGQLEMPGVLSTEMAASTTEPSST